MNRDFGVDGRARGDWLQWDYQGQEVARAKIAASRPSIFRGELHFILYLKGFLSGASGRT
ncbi:MAG: hypothetical protein ABSC18_11990 [Verrucomicrobiota bacterium]